MELFIILLCLATMVVFGHGEDLSVNFENPVARSFFVGETGQNLKCQINKPLVFLFENPSYIIHKDLAGKETILYERTSRKEASPDHYELQRIDAKDTNTFVFKIFSVREEDEGSYICRVREGDKSTEASVDIKIKRNIESVRLKFADRPENAKYTVDAGSYEVKCTAIGSNPAVTNLKLYLNDKPVDGKIETLQPVSTENRFDTILTAEVKIDVENSGQKLECVAEQPFQVAEGGEQMISSNSSTLEVNDYTPVISCTEAKAYTGMLLAKLACTVDHSNLNIKEFKFLIENPTKGTTELKVDEDRDDDSVVKLESVEEGTTKVTLILAETKDWHLESQFFLVVENKNGFVTRVPVTLREVKGGNGSVAVSSALAVLLLAFSTALLLKQ